MPRRRRRERYARPAVAEESVQETPKTSAPKAWLWPLGIYLIVTGLYALTLGPRVLETSPDNHYAYLAQSWLEGQLHHSGNPPGTNDWACFDQEALDNPELDGFCPNNRWRFGDERYRWYVSFPPLPAAVILPAVALFGVDVPDRLFWVFIAGFGPMLLFLLLQRMSREGKSDRSRRENLLLTVLFAFGTVFFFTAVQGTVWFSAHVVATSLLMLYLWFGQDCRRPVLAGAMLGLAFLTRPTTALLCLFFAVEILRTQRRQGAHVFTGDASPYGQILPWLKGVDWPKALRTGALFAAPILAVGALAMAHNQARFGNPFEFGHTYLQIRWRGRIETWGLFNYHFFAKNLSVYLAGLPWLSAEAPYVMVSRHGLALWFTTPALLLALWPKRLTAPMIALWCAIVPVALLNLSYQNSGWVQFGYRFALDYMPLLFVLLALGKRRFGPLFHLALVFAIAVNLFGAVTFDRAWEHYDNDGTQERLFQPD